MRDRSELHVFEVVGFLADQPEVAERDAPLLQDAAGESLAGLAVMSVELVLRVQPVLPQNGPESLTMTRSGSTGASRSVVMW